MRELALIADALARAAADGDPTLLATVVRTEGSTYRKPGARMLVRADATAVGTVSGGCLDADLLARWAALTAGGRPARVTYDLRGPDDLVWGLGLGCDGLVEVLLEPVAPSDAASLAALLGRCAAVDRPAVLVTRLDGAAAGGRVLVQDGAAVAHWRRPGAPDPDPHEALAVAAGGSAGGSAAGDAGLAVERLTPAVRLLVCGAGVDAAPLVRLAAGLGWHVTVTDDRPAYARPDRFPGAAVRRLAPDAVGTGALPLPSGVAAVVMSHSYERDLAYLGALAARTGALAYVGPLGPRRRTERMLAELGEAGRPVPDAFRALVHAPAGLDVGGEGPEAIALAIVAEVAAVAHGRAGGMLRDRPARGDAPPPMASPVMAGPDAAPRLGTSPGRRDYASVPVLTYQ